MIPVCAVSEFGAFEWWSDIWIPAAVGCASIAVAAASWWASWTATKIARNADSREVLRLERQERYEFAQALLRYFDKPAVETALASRWTVALSGDESRIEIVRWAQAQVPRTPAVRAVALTELDGRLQHWVQSGDLDRSDLLGPEIREMGL